MATAAKSPPGVPGFPKSWTHPKQPPQQQPDKAELPTPEKQEHSAPQQQPAAQQQPVGQQTRRAKQPEQLAKQEPEDEASSTGAKDEAAGEPAKHWDPIPAKNAQGMLQRLNYLGKTGKPAAKQHYDNLSQQGKREFYHTVYSMDPKLASWCATDEHQRKEETISEGERGWFTGERIAKMQGFTPEGVGDRGSWILIVGAVTKNLEGGLTRTRSSLRST